MPDRDIKKTTILISLLTMKPRATSVRNKVVNLADKSTVSRDHDLLLNKSKTEL